MPRKSYEMFINSIIDVMQRISVQTKLMFRKKIWFEIKNILYRSDGKKCRSQYQHQDENEVQ